MGIIISSFVGCGRRYFQAENADKKLRMVNYLNDGEDDDSFVNGVLEKASDNDIVFVPADKRTRTVLNDNKIEYDVYYPSFERRGEFIENEVRKHTNPNIIRDINNNFREWIEDIDNDDSETCYKHKLVESGKYIGNDPLMMAYVKQVLDNRKQCDIKKEEETENDQD